MYLAYLDDSDTRQKQERWQVLTAVIVEDQHFNLVELLSSMVIEGLLPPEKYAEFEEFHACELYGGYGVFSEIEQSKRFDAIDTLLQAVQNGSVVIVYGAVDLERLSKQVYASANPVDIAFRSCASGVEKWLESKAAQNLSECDFEKGIMLPSSLCLFIADDGDKKDKAALQSSFRDMRRRMRPPVFEVGQLTFVHDDMYFGDSKFSIGIQFPNTEA